MLLLNVRRLNQNFESLEKLLTTIKFEFKVICLTETWCTDDPRNEILESNNESNNDIESFVIEIINKKAKMLSLVHSVENQPVF